MAIQVLHVLVSVYISAKSLLQHLGGYVETERNFGVIKKGSYRPASDFSFEFVAEIIASLPRVLDL